MTRQTKINKLVDITRDDLREETRSFLNLCTDDDLNDIIRYKDKLSIVFLEIEHKMLKYLVFGKIKSEDFKGWELKDSPMLDSVKEKYLGEVRINKIDSLIN